MSARASIRRNSTRSSTLNQLLQALVLVVFVAAWLTSRREAIAAAPPLEPVYWQQRLFFVPYKIVERDTLISRVTKVQLLSSRTGANDWTVLKEATPEIQGFSYYAPQDGEYWFALRHLDRLGRPWPSAEVRPQMRVVVDTARPEFSLASDLDSSGLVLIRYDARDVNLHPESLRIEARVASGPWKHVTIVPPDLLQPDRLMGRVQWQPPPGANHVEFRASIADRSGHRVEAEHKVTVAGPSLSFPADRGVVQTQIPSALQTTGSGADPFLTALAAARHPSQDWPVTNHLAQPPPAQSKEVNAFGSSAGTPPADNPYNAKGQPWPDRTPAQCPDSFRGLVPLGRVARTPKVEVGKASELVPVRQASSPLDTDTQRTQSWTTSPSTTDSGERLVNSRIFELDYDLQSIGPWGVSKVELWGTHDGGQTWQRYGVDPHSRSPMRVTVGGAGTFGFLILVDGAKGVGAAPPRPGAEPELLVRVDLQPPSSMLEAVELGQGNLADHLHIRWSAQDTNLEPRPIGLFYSSFPGGPWSTIATGLENSGSYTWRIERHVPDRFYLRLEVRDTAGNLASFVLPSPISLDRPKPSSRLRSVQPVESGA